MGIHRIEERRSGRLSVALALSLGLVLAALVALAAPAGAANGVPDRASRAGKQSHVDRTAVDRVFHLPGGGGPAARLAASGGASPTRYLNGLIDAASSAAGVSGPAGFALGAALFFIKEIIGLADGGDEAQDAYAKLTEIGDQLAELKKQLGDAVFDLQVGKTDDWIVDIRETAENLRAALAHAKKADNKGLSEEERQNERRAFRSSMAEFVDGAHKLVQDNVAAKLNTALIDQQVAGEPGNPVKKPPLLPQLRRSIAGEKFLTAERSAKIRDFFKYYEWWQVRLATVLSEYYMLGGPCAWTNPPPDCEKPPKPDRARAKDRIGAIQTNIERQRQVAGLPAKYLDQEPLRGQVFIDTKSNYMWGVEPTYRSAAQITRTGNFSKCGVSTITWPFSENCQLNATNQFAGYSNWVVPLKDQALSLFNGQKGDALSWLGQAGVSFVPAGRFPGYGGGFLAVRFGLLLRDRWSLSAPHRTTIFENYTRAIDGDVLALQYSKGGPLDQPEIFAEKVADYCPVHQSLIPYYPIYNAPDCKDPQKSAGGFILWIRGVTAADRRDYYVTPPPK
jgi:hypothetical protein